MNTIARKTFTSNEVKKRFADKTYRRYTISLRLDTDPHIINLLEQGKAEGISPTQIIRSLCNLALVNEE